MLNVADDELGEGPLRVLCARLIWQHKIHEKQTDIYVFHYKFFNCLSIGATALTGCGIFSTFLNQATWIRVCSLLTTAIALFSSLYTKSIDYNQLIIKERKSAEAFLRLRDRSFSLLYNVKHETIELPDLEKELNGIFNDYHRLCAEAPRITDHANDKARKALQKGSGSDYKNSEIDELLPEYLRQS